MKKPPIEKEAKFYISDLSALEERVRRLGGTLLQPRTHELNYRFDTEDHKLTASARVLRLRRDQKFILTYKGPSMIEGEVLARPEIELEVDNFENAIDFFKSLGYTSIVTYEKWRTTYSLNALEVTMDEMPFGTFSEIEGEDTDTIRRTATALALDWDCRINNGYMALFNQLNAKLGLNLTDLTFVAFKALSITPRDLGVRPADTLQYL